MRLAASGVSRVHAGVRVHDGRAVIEDRGSKNGTWVNSKRIDQPVALAAATNVFIASYRFVFRSSAVLDSTRTGPVTAPS